MSTHRFSVYLESGEMELELDCEFEYEPGGGDGWHEPRYPESFTLATAKIGAIDIYEALTAAQVEDITQRAAVALAEDARDAAAEAQFERMTGAYA